MKRIMKASSKLIAMLCFMVIGNSGYSQNSPINDTLNISYKLHHAGLAVHNIDKMQQWYSRCFQLSVVQHFEMENPPVKSVMLEGKNGFRVELIALKGSERKYDFTDPLSASKIEGYGHIAFEVSNLKAAFDKLVNAGAKAVVPPSPAVKKGDTYAYVKDIEGNLIELIQPGV